MDSKKRKKPSAKLKTNISNKRVEMTPSKLAKTKKVKNKVIRKSLRKSVEPDTLNSNNNVDTVLVSVLPRPNTPKKRMNSICTLTPASSSISNAKAGTKRKAESKGMEKSPVDKEKGHRVRITKSKDKYNDIISPPAKKAKKSLNDNNVSKVNSAKNNKQPKKPQKRTERENSSKSPAPATLNPHFVEFEFDGKTEYFGIKAALNIIDNTSFEGFTEPSTPFSFMQDDSYPSSPMTPISGHLHHKKGRGGAGKGKGNKKNKGKNNKSQKNSGISTQQQLLAAALLAAELEDKKQSKLPGAQFEILEDFKMSEAPTRPNAAYIRYIEVPQEELENDVEYELDEEDLAWLELINKMRREISVQNVKPDIMELLMDRLEKESHFQMQSSDYEHKPLIDDDAVCCICMDGECQNANAILFCDMCNLAVHQECYGVPYIPEGQWLCRRCLQSPSRAVDCALCPNKGNAFKETNDGRWAHVVCAIWIPEVCFANTVFLEPVDNISSIPTARWKLCCYICKQKGVGACIQCHKSNCYTAFHVTCAQQAGLYMKMDTVKDSHSYVVKKIAYCDNHAPPDDDKDSPTSRQRMRRARKLLAEKRIEIPTISIPTIPNERVEQIASLIAFPKKNQFLKRLMAYWKIKRQTRNGVPLLRRLQSANPFPSLTGTVDNEKKKNTNARDSYRYYVKLRQDIEKARLLCELVRKREKLKREEVHTRCREVIYKIQPMIHFFHNLLEELSRADIQGIFAEPVNTQEVVDYLDIVRKPMDFSTMKEKISSYEYNSVDDLEKDFNLIITNCLTYNSRDTVFFRTASKVKEHGEIILRQAKKEWIFNAFDPETGLHSTSTPPKRPSPLTDEKLSYQIDAKLDDDSRLSLPFDKHLKLLNELYDNSLEIDNPMARKKRLNRIRNETQRIKKQKYQKPTEILSNYSKSLAEQLLREKARKSELLTTDSEELSHQEDSQDSFKFLKRRLSSALDKNNLVDDEDGEFEKEESEESEPQPRVLRPLKKKEEQKPLNGKKVKKSPAKSVEMSKETPLGSKNARLRKLSVSTNGPLFVEKDVEKNQQLVSVSSSLIPKRKKKKNKKNVKGRKLSTKKYQRVSEIEVVTLDDETNSSTRYFSNNEKVASRYFSREKEKEETHLDTFSDDVGVNNNSSSKKKDKLKKKNKKEEYSTANHLKLSNSKKLLYKVVVESKKGIDDGEQQQLNKTESNKRKKKKLQKHVQNGGINNNNNINSIDGGGGTGGFITKFTKAVEKIFGNSPKKTDSFTTYRNSGGTDGVVSEDENDTKLQKRREILEDLSSTSETENNTRDDDEVEKVEKVDDITVYDKFSSSSSSSSESETDDVDVSKGNQNNVKILSTQDSASVDTDTIKPRKPYKSNNKKFSKMKQQQQQNLVFNSNSNQQNNNKMDVHVYAKKSYPVFNDNDSAELQNNDKRNEIISNDIADEELDEDTGLVLDSVKRRQLMLQAPLTPLDLVWAKYSGYDCWHPGVIIDPNSNISQNNGQIPRPPVEIVNKKPLSRSEVLYLVLFFDIKSTWEWVERSELVPLGRNPELDKDQLDLSLKKPSEKKAVRRAYEKAILRQKIRSGSESCHYVAENYINSSNKTATTTKNNNSSIYSD